MELYLNIWLLSSTQLDIYSHKLIWKTKLMNLIVWTQRQARSRMSAYLKILNMNLIGTEGEYPFWPCIWLQWQKSLLVIFNWQNMTSEFTVLKPINHQNHDFQTSILTQFSQETSSLLIRSVLNHSCQGRLRSNFKTKLGPRSCAFEQTSPAHCRREPPNCRSPSLTFEPVASSTRFLSRRGTV